MIRQRHSHGLQRRARGAAYVEVLVIVGVVLLLGVLAVTALGRSSSDQAEKEADCIRTFSCGGGPGSGGGDVSSFAGKAGSEAPAASKGVRGTTADVAKGFFVDGLWGTVKGIGTAIIHPVDTVTGIGHAIAHPIATASTIKQGVVTAWNDNPERLVGAGLFEVVTLPVAAAKSAKVVSVASKIDDVADAAKAADRLADASKAAKAAGAADDAVADASKARKSGAAPSAAEAAQARLDKMSAEQAKASFEHAFQKVNGRQPSAAETHAAMTGGMDAKVKAQTLKDLAVPAGKKIAIHGPKNMDGVRRMSELSADTPVYRVQPSELPMAPHKSDFFVPTEYGMPITDRYEALYVATDKKVLEELRRKQGYFDDGAVMHEAKLGDLVASSGPDTMVFEDVKYRWTIGSEAYVIVRRVP